MACIPLRAVVHGLHVTRLHDAVGFGQVLLRERLIGQTVSDYGQTVSDYGQTLQQSISQGQTYHLITCLANLLPHQLVDPFGLIAHVRVDARNNERHDGGGWRLNRIRIYILVF